MNKSTNWNDVEEYKEYPKVKPGGYICKIVEVEDNEKQEYLKLSYDIADGEFRDLYTKLNAERNFDFPYFFKSYKDKAMGFFKGMLTALECSNKNFTVEKFDNDPKKLKGLFVGLILGEEEYINKNDGEVKTSIKVQETRSIKVIQDNAFETPKLKKLKPQNSTAPTWQPVDDEELPF